MHLITRNVNTAFRTLVQVMNGEEFPGSSSVMSNDLADATHDPVSVIKRTSRNGPVLMIDEPVTVTYTHPKERVLFNAARDANPFFHLYEALWMMAGRNDVASVAYYASNMVNYSDDGKTLNGAYGYRWRHASYSEPEHYGKFQLDQLDMLVDHLKADPGSRRAVLQMWNVEDDLLKISDAFTKCTERGCTNGRWTNAPGLALIEGQDCPVCKGTNKKLVSKASKDVCCNLSVMFSIKGPEVVSDDDGPKLDMTVTNRSNDMIWGMLGANYVHFTVLQEYMAARLGVEVGRYNHFTNNLHVYESNWKPEEWMTAEKYDGTDRYRNELYSEGFPGIRQTIPLVYSPEAFDRELPEFVEQHSGRAESHRVPPYTEPFLERVARPMLFAFHNHKMKNPDLARVWANRIEADDWRTAAQGWLQRRIK